LKTNYLRRLRFGVRRCRFDKLKALSPPRGCTAFGKSVGLRQPLIYFENSLIDRTRELSRTTMLERGGRLCHAAGKEHQSAYGMMPEAEPSYSA
jgi:hypothetical protein